METRTKFGRLLAGTFPIVVFLGIWLASRFLEIGILMLGPLDFFAFGVRAVMFLCGVVLSVRAVWRYSWMTAFGLVILTLTTCSVPDFAGLREAQFVYYKFVLSAFPDYDCRSSSPYAIPDGILRICEQWSWDSVGYTAGAMLVKIEGSPKALINHDLSRPPRVLESSRLLGPFLSVGYRYSHILDGYYLVWFDGLDSFNG